MTDRPRKLRYQVVEGWGKLPEGWRYTQVAGVAVDSRDRIYVFNRSDHPVIIFNGEGEFQTSWGEGVFRSPHSIHVSPDDRVYCADSGDHTVRSFTIEGELVFTLGTVDQPGEDGQPFNRPTCAMLAPSGLLYVSDGYGNSRIHAFSPDGELLHSWGSKGDDPGQFDIPHGIWVDDDFVYVADRQNDRVQIFTKEGGYLRQWTGFARPCSVFMDAERNVYIPELRARMSIMNTDGETLARWGGEKSDAPGLFAAPHCACVDSNGDLYIGEVLDGQRIQKFKRIS